MDIVLRVDHNSTYLDGKLDSKIYQEFKRHLGYLPEEAYWIVRNTTENNSQAWRKQWDGYISTVCWNKDKCKCSVKKPGTHFPTGLISSAISFFRSKNISFAIIDHRQKHTKTLNLSLSGDYEHRDYQQEVIEKACAVDRGLIKICTGGGKTFIATAIIANRGVSPSIFYVPSIDLLGQAKTEIEKLLRINGSNIKVGEICGIKKDIQEITVMTIQTAVRALGGVWVKFDDEDSGAEEEILGSKEEIKKLIHNAKLIISDEVQHWAAETCQIISDNSFAAQYRYGMSATIKRDQGDDILIDSCFGKCIADINASKLIKLGYLVKPKIRFIPISNKRGMSKSTYANVYKEAVVDNEVRNNTIANLATGLAERGGHILILCKHIVHGNKLEDLIPGSVFLHGSHSAKERRVHLEKMRTGEARITIASSIFDEGIDCRALDGLILAGSGKSPTRALQRIGRVLRPYTYPDGVVKTEATIIDFMDHCKYLESHSKKRLKIYKTEEEFDIGIL